MITIALRLALIAVTGLAGGGWHDERISPDRKFAEACDRDKTGTTARAANDSDAQVPAILQLAILVSFRAEGKGFEPSTPFGAPDFESGR